MIYDVIIIGAGAAGMMCAIEAGKRHQHVLLLEKSNKPGRKILMSGGGRCNFTNLDIQPECFISQNKHFAKSALSRYTQWDFIEMVNHHKIAYHEKTLGQLFCDNKASDIVEMLLKEIAKYAVKIQLETNVSNIQKTEFGFTLKSNDKFLKTKSLVIATGGLSIPSMGSNPFAYQIAEQFGLHVLPTRAGLVPFTLHVHDKEKLCPLSGVSLESCVSVGNIAFKEGLLFTHRGLSGPSILQISSYWKPGDTVEINLLPTIYLLDFLKEKQQSSPKQLLKTVLTHFFAQRLLDIWFEASLLNKRLADISHVIFSEIAAQLHSWQIRPNATEGYRTAEVTLGGVDTCELSSKTLEAQKVPGLFFIGEAVDVTGWLGGYNFQWAWSSGWAAGQAC
ncbi:MAG: NAD(P)/FAD-dependent oxidoreductase [Pseudomonadota bacterium]